MLSKIFVFLLREHQRHVWFDYHDLSFAFPSKLLAICSGGEGFLWGGGEKSHGFQGERSRDQSSPTGHKRGWGGKFSLHYKILTFPSVS